MNTEQTWKLPIAFLLGFLFAWGLILLDRQMIIDEQRLLQQELDLVRIEQTVTTMIEDYNEDYTSQVEWNSEIIESKEEGASW